MITKVNKKSIKKVSETAPLSDENNSICQRVSII